MNTKELFISDSVLSLREDLALALRAAAHHNLAEGICNHMSIEVPNSQYFLLNPRGFLWSEIQAEDIIMVDLEGIKLEGKHEVERTAMFIHAAVCPPHTHALCYRPHTHYSEDIRHLSLSELNAIP